MTTSIETGYRVAGRSSVRRQVLATTAGLLGLAGLVGRAGAHDETYREGGVDDQRFGTEAPVVLH